MLKRVLTPRVMSALDSGADILLLVDLGLLICFYSVPSAQQYMALMDGIMNCSLMYLFFEVLMRMLYHGRRFWLGRWNVFDLVVTLIAMFSFSQSLIAMRFFRLVRLVRLFRLFSINEQMRRIMSSLTKGLGRVLWTFFLILIFFVLYAIVGVDLFSSAFPDYFGGFFESMFTLFQCMTLESWASGIARQTMDVFPWSWIYFVSFILITNYVLVNLIIGIITSATMEVAQERIEDQQQDMTETIRTLSDEIAKLRKEIQQLKDRG